MKQYQIQKITSKSQLTVFMILGILILAAFALVFYFASESTKSKMLSQQKKILHNILNSQPMQYYMSTCIDNALLEGLKTLSMQGGYFFENQPGNIYPSSAIPRITYRQYNVSYLIYPINGVYYDWYPCLSESNYPRYCEFKNTIPNSLNYFSSSRLPAPLSIIEKQLGLYVSKKAKDCLESELLANPLNYQISSFTNYIISSGEPSAEVSIYPEKIIVILNYPLKLEVPGFAPIIELKKFKSELNNLRFKVVYEIVEDIINKEIHYLNFDAELSQQTYTTQAGEEFVKLSLYPGISLRKEKVAGGDSIITIKDSVSRLGDEDLVFQFAVRNMPPALDFISRYPSLQNIYDYLVIEGDNTAITANATDPDGDSVYYYFNGNPSNNNYLQINTTIPRYENITVSVSDLYLLDNQLVRLLVDRKLAPIIIMNNSYSDIPQNWASWEDIFYLNATPTANSLDPYALYDYTWGIICGDTGTTIKGECVILPSKSSCLSTLPPINQIKNANFNLLGNCQLYLRVNLSYNGFSQINQTHTTDLKITQCIPHRSDISSYPYHTGDPFQANHTCCYDNGTIKPASETCYEKTNYICPVGILTYKFYKESASAKCTGTQGNICGQLQTTSLVKSDYCGCRAANECQNLLPYQSRRNMGWCYGIEGCSAFCTSAVVDANSNNLADEGDICGCQNEGAKCDKNFDGIFNGLCKANTIFGITIGYYCNE